MPIYTIRFTTRELPFEMIKEGGIQLYNKAHKNRYLKGLDYIQNSSNYLLGYYVDGPSFRYLLLNKQTLQLEVAYNYVIGDLGDLNFYFFYTTPHNELIVMQPASMMLTNWKSCALKVKDKIIKRKVDQIMNTLTEEDNPILFKYTFQE